MYLLFLTERKSCCDKKYVPLDIYMKKITVAYLSKEPVLLSSVVRNYVKLIEDKRARNESERAINNLYYKADFCCNLINKFGDFHFPLREIHRILTRNLQLFNNNMRKVENKKQAD